MVVRKGVFGVVAAAVFTAVLSSANAAVYSPQQQLPQQVVADFKSSPAGLLSQFPQGGATLISRVRDLGASDPSTLPGLISLLTNSSTSKDQMRAIVAGLAQVARLAAKSDQAYADEIQRAIAGTNNADVVAAYQAATGDVAIAATGGGGGGGGGGSGSGGATGGGLAFGGGNTGTGTSVGGLHYATTGSGIGSGGNAGGVTSSVSPH